MPRTLDRDDNFQRRPWPVSPHQYPLSGPSKGPVYSPPPTFGRSKRNPFLDVIAVAFLLGLFIAACGISGAFLMHAIIERALK